MSDESVQEGQDKQRKRRLVVSDEDEHEEDTGPQKKFRKIDGNQIGQYVDSDIVLDLQRRMESTGRVSDNTLKYCSSILDEEGFKEISKDIRQPDNESMAPPEFNYVIIKPYLTWEICCILSKLSRIWYGHSPS